MKQSKGSERAPVIDGVSEISSGTAALLLTLSVLLVSSKVAAAERDPVSAPPVCAATVSQSVALRDVVTTALDAQPQLLIAKEAVAKARANLIAARSPFLPSVDLSYQSERFVPTQIIQPITIGNTVVGGSLATKTSYGSIGLQWNLYSGGKDAAGYHAAQSDEKSNEEGLNHQLDETLIAVLSAYADVYTAQRDAETQGRILFLQQQIERTTEQQYRQGTTTTLVIAQAQTDVLETSKAFYQACRNVADKSATLAQTVGLHLSPDELYRIDQVPPEPLDRTMTASEWEAIIQDDPGVVAAKQEVTAAEYKVKQAKASYGPTLALEGRKDYLGQDPDSWRTADHITPNSYRIGLMIQQPLMPLTSEYSAIQSAKSDLRKAQATYQQTMLETESKYHAAMNAMRATDASADAAQQNLIQAQALLTLTQSQFASGRITRDKVQQAQIVVEKASEAVDQAITEQHLSRWLVVRATEPRLFPNRLLNQLAIDITAH